METLLINNYTSNYSINLIVRTYNYYDFEDSYKIRYDVSVTKTQ